MQGETIPMRRIAVIHLLVLCAFVALGAQAAWAGSPHFVSNTVTVSRTDNTLTVSGKEAGLGDESQVHIVVRATAACITRYSWNWGDGTTPTVTTSGSASHTYSTGGVSRTITLTVTDNYGMTGTATRSVAVS